MKVGLFLDVDKTLTKKFIQQEYAKLLGCEDDYRYIESEFQNGKISSLEFGEKIIDIFKTKGFTSSFARAHFDSIELHNWTDDLLKMDVDIFLISSGPSYYIDDLANKYGIPKDRVCRSEYIFDRKTDMIQSCHAINVQQKASFVKKYVSSYDISIGIGDHPEFDGPFISLCTISILTCSRDGYLYAPSFSTSMSLIQKLLSHKIENNDVIEIRSKTLGDIFRNLKHLTLGSITFIFAVILGTIGIGMWVQKVFF